jgi:hypothetical protein
MTNEVFRIASGVGWDEAGVSLRASDARTLWSKADMFANFHEVADFSFELEDDLDNEESRRPGYWG